MKNFSNIARVRSLMLLSLLLLSAFLAKWLVSQYHEASAILIKDLTQEFTSSKQEVMDSMILINIIDPIFKKKNAVNVNVELNAEAQEIHNFIPTSRDSITILNKSEIKTLDITGAPIPFGDKMITLRSDSGDLKKDILMHGVKLIYKEVSSAVNDSLGQNAALYYKTDTTMLKKLLADRLKEKGFDFRIAWINDKAVKNTVSTKDTLYFETNLYPKAFGVNISDYKYFLYQKILPQLSFALLLLLLTAASFLLAYNSLRKQISLGILRNDFISNISHELKTPVSTVKVALEALNDAERRGDPAVVDEYLAIASIEMNRLEVLVEKVMNTSLLESDQQLMRPERTELNELIRSTLRSQEKQFAQRQAVISFNDTDNAIFLMLDKIHIQGVILNLIENSLKYGPEFPVVNIAIMEHENSIELYVDDNGPGIPEEYLQKVFEKFFRVPNGDQHNIKGYGLGLSYCSLVLKQHHAGISAENLPGAGSRFKIRFQKQRS